MNIYEKFFHQFSEDKNEYFQIYGTTLKLLHVSFSSE